jgi:hypothetical protein
MIPAEIYIKMQNPNQEDILKKLMEQQQQQQMKELEIMFEK